MTDPEIRCKTCPVIVKMPVAGRRSITGLYKNIKLFVSRNISGDKHPAQFSSQTGTLTSGNGIHPALVRWRILSSGMDCGMEGRRFPGSERLLIFKQPASSRKLHALRLQAAENCKLRDLAEEFSLKDPKGKLVNAPISKR
jgi:hypothetical protein